jgi:hypothetical protein
VDTGSRSYESCCGVWKYIRFLAQRKKKRNKGGGGGLVTGQLFNSSFLQKVAPKKTAADRISNQKLRINAHARVVVLNILNILVVFGRRNLLI